MVSDTAIVHSHRVNAAGKKIAVENDDHGQLLARFASGATGSVTFSRVAAGREMGYSYEIIGTKGAIAFDQERKGERHLYQAGEPAAREGFKRILTGPAHPDYVNFCLGAGHGIGYYDQIVIEARDFVRAIAGRDQVWPTFRDGYEADRVVETVLRAKDTGGWAAIETI